MPDPYGTPEMFEVERMSGRERLQRIRSVAQAKCPGCDRHTLKGDVKLTGLVHQGPHLVWRYHDIVTWSGARRPLCDRRDRLVQLWWRGMRPDWMDRAACREYPPDAWFPEDSAETAVAQHICARCPVRAECDAYAIVHDERYGVWGGKTRGRRDGGDGFCRRCRAVVVAGHGVRYCADCRAEARAETRARARARAAS